MPGLSSLIGSAARMVGRSLLRRATGGRRRHHRTVRRGQDEHLASPGRDGPSRTVEVDPGAVGRVSMSYAPQADGQPDPGEVVWTWVPYEENDGRGKDRPVLLVAAEDTGTLLGVQLTSKRHSDGDHVAVGTGGWDSSRRPSWAVLDRVMRVHPDGMRREGSALPARRFGAVADRLRARYGWREA